MHLVRNRNGTLYFLTRDSADALEVLRASYPGRPVAVLSKEEGLSILRVGQPGSVTDAEIGEGLAIVSVVLPPAPAAFSYRG